MQTGKRGASWSVALIVLLVLAVGANGLLGQNSTEASSPVAPVVDSSWPDVILNVVVTDKHGVPQKIDERAFRLFEDGTERLLHFPDAADSPVSLALIIDSSGSIHKRKPELLSLVEGVIHALPADSEVMAVLFTNQAYLDLPLTQPPKSISRSWIGCRLTAQRLFGMPFMQRRATSWRTQSMREGL